MLYPFDILAIIALAGAPASQEATSPTLCENDENTILYGQVQDDFGFDVAVCLSGGEDNQRLTIRWVGEGGGSSVSCSGDDCQGRIEYARYTSPQLTILTLGWIADGKKQMVTQTFSREGMDAEPQTYATHRWYPEEQSWIEASADGNIAYPMTTQDGPLALMAVEDVLSVKPGSHPLFGEAQ